MEFEQKCRDSENTTEDFGKYSENVQAGFAAPGLVSLNLAYLRREHWSFAGAKFHLITVNQVQYLQVYFIK